MPERYIGNVALYQFASFDGMGTVPTTGLSPIIKQLAGIPRPQVA
jgi:hypothetical protein